jgi:hypothetical protein
MAFNPNPKHLFLGLGVVSLIFLASFGGFLAYAVLSNQQAVHYPGSAQLTSHDVVKLSPHLYYRQDKVYLTEDNFRSVYRWYSNEFGLGPQANGQSNCISVFNTETTFRITKVMTVMLCDTRNGRMIFTERSWRLESR